ncbi:MAG: hypothetical protein NVS3B5_00800 [Sphingomicrobium sp.]
MPDMVRTPHNGGHWIATRAAGMENSQEHHHDLFSIKQIVLRDDRARGGSANSQPDLLDTVSNLKFGGLDTIMALLGFADKYLAKNAGRPRALVERAELIPNAVDVLLPMIALSSAARFVTREPEYNGIGLKALRLSLACDQATVRGPPVASNSKGPLYE